MEEETASSSAERSPAGALPDDGDDDGDAKLRHIEQVPCDGLGNAALLGSDSGIGARCIDEANDRPSEFLRHFHESKGFSVPLRMWHAKVSFNFFFGVSAFLMPNDHDAVGPTFANATHDGWVISKTTVPF